MTCYKVMDEELGLEVKIERTKNIHRNVNLRTFSTNKDLLTFLSTAFSRSFDSHPTDFGYRM